MSYPIGKCPKCGEMISKGEMNVRQIRSTFWRPHFAYICKRCDNIIGFGSNAPWYICSKSPKNEFRPHSTNTCLKINVETAITAKKKANNNLISGTTPMRFTPEMILLVAKVPGMRIGTETGKKRNERSRVFPSEYITIAETMDPTRARLTTPKMKTVRRFGMTDMLMLRKTVEEAIVAMRTVKSITAP